MQVDFGRGQLFAAERGAEPPGDGGAGAQHIGLSYVGLPSDSARGAKPLPQPHSTASGIREATRDIYRDAGGARACEASPLHPKAGGGNNLHQHLGCPGLDTLRTRNGTGGRTPCRMHSSRELPRRNTLSSAIFSCQVVKELVQTVVAILSIGCPLRSETPLLCGVALPILAEATRTDEPTTREHISCKLLMRPHC